MNHIIIGLGGTGGQVMRGMRKILQERHGNLTSISEDGRSANFDYIYVDSNTVDTGNCQHWTTHDGSVLAEHIGLQPNNIIHIPAVGLQDRINNLHNFPITAKYIGNTAVWPEVMNGLALANGAAGQVRRIGEAIFENGVKAFRHRVERSVQTLNAIGGPTIEFHVIAGLAGGTGSGIFLQVMAQLRSLYAANGDIVFLQ